MAATGSIKRLALNGVNYNVMADANFSETPATLNEAVATSGPNVHKITRQVAMVSGVVVDASNPIAYQTLLDLQDQATSFSISYTKADGSVRSGSGRINLENKETEEGRATLSLIPDLTFDLIPA